MEILGTTFIVTRTIYFMLEYKKKLVEKSSTFIFLVVL